MGQARNERRLTAKKQKWVQMVHEELKKDRHHILSQNHDNIRKVAAHVAGMALVVALVDCEPALAKGFGNEEAGRHYLKWRQSRREHAISWMCVPWEDADKMMSDLKSTEWKQWKATAEAVGTEMLCAVCINGFDDPNGHGSFRGFTYVLIPKEGDVDRTLVINPLPANGGL
jgi:hypothetical protein